MCISLTDLWVKGAGVSACVDTCTCIASDFAAGLHTFKQEGRVCVVGYSEAAHCSGGPQTAWRGSPEDLCHTLPVSGEANLSPPSSPQRSETVV